MAGYAKLTGNVHWNTPSKYATAIKSFFGEIDLDPCSNETSIIESRYKYILPQHDGLKEPWMKHTYVNPPYGRGIKEWFAKAYKESLKGNEIVMLVPVSTNTSHWKKYVYGKASAVCFLYDTRLKFRIDESEDNKGCPMACCLIYYGPVPQILLRILENMAIVMQKGFGRRTNDDDL